MIKKLFLSLIALLLLAGSSVAFENIAMPIVIEDLDIQSISPVERQETISPLLEVGTRTSELTYSTKGMGIPSKAISNPINQAIYVPDNASTPASIRMYVRGENSSAGIAGWYEYTNRGIPIIELTGSQTCFGLAVSPNGKKLYVSINDFAGVAHKLRSYDLDLDGRPILSSLKDFGWNWAIEPYASPAGIVALDHVVYMADMGAGRIHMFNPSSGQREGNIILSNQAGLFDVAVTPPEVTANWTGYWFFVLQKANQGKVFVYYSLWPNGQSPTHTYVGVITGLKAPTSLKVSPDGKYLYITVNGDLAGDPDVEVYEVSKTLPAPYFKLTAKITSGATGGYGWTGLDISPDNKYLLFTQELVSGNVGLHQVSVSSVKTANGSTLTATKIKNVALPYADSIVISSDGKRCAAANSGSGKIKLVEDPWLTNNLLYLLPKVTSVTPNITAYGTGVNVTINGENFRQGGIASINAYLYAGGTQATIQNLSNVNIVNPNQITASIPANPIVMAGKHDLVVDNRYLNIAQTYTGALVDGFSINFTQTSNLTGEAKDVGGAPLPAGQVRWSWTQLNQGEEGYKLYDAITNNLIITLTKNDLSYTEMNLSPNTQYSRYVVAYNSDLNSAKSKTSMAHSAAAIPSGIQTSNITASSVDISWDANNNPANTKYVVSRHIRFSTDPFIAVGTTTATSLTDNTNLVVGQEYSYVVKALNNAGLETLDSQAAFATIGASTTTVDVNNIKIKRDGDIANSSTISLEWQTTPTNKAVDIWSKDTTFATTGWTKLSSIVAGTTTYTDSGIKVGDGKIRFYKILPSGATSVTTDDLTQEVLVKFDLDLDSGNNLVSLPLIPEDTSMDKVIGAQLTGGPFSLSADMIQKYTGSGYEKAWLNSTGNKWYTGSNLTSIKFEPDLGYIITAKNKQYVTVVGKIPAANRSISINANKQQNLIGTAYPIEIHPDNSGLAAKATAGPFSILATTIQTPKKTGGYYKAWLKAPEKKWYTDSSPTTLKFQPGKGYWISDPGTTNYIWDYNKPY